jgi:hypothetical protein
MRSLGSSILEQATDLIIIMAVKKSQDSVAHVL